MSDEESFVILGSSPMSSLEVDGVEAKRNYAEKSLEFDKPGIKFTSLKSSQIIALRNALDVAGVNEMVPERDLPDMMTGSMKKTTEETGKDEEMAASKLWSRPPQAQLEENILPLGLEDCALKSPLVQQQQQQNTKSIEEILSTSVNQEQSTMKKTPSISADKNLASSFLMGEVNSDVLKTSVYSQFPSISMEACAEDVLKLQNMVTEYSELKATIKKANNTMKLFYNNSLQWKEKMNTIEQQYKEQLEKCQKEIEELRERNIQMEDNFTKQIQALEIARENDHEGTIMEISEKNALLENMRAQIIKLEQQQLGSFEYVLEKAEEEQQTTEHSNKTFVTHHEYDIEIKNLQRQLSEMLASNLDLKDVEKQYIDELNCLKVNLTAAEELIKKNCDEITQLTAASLGKQERIATLENSLKTLQMAFEEQKERIVLLETQNEVYRTDFEMEKQSRETAVKEKQQILQDLRSLQKRNRELIEEHQKLADTFQKRLSISDRNSDVQLAASAASAKSYLDNPQRPIRPLPSTSAASATVVMHNCPICNKAFKSLNILLCHVNDCVDKN